MIPILDLRAQYASIKDELDDAVLRVLAGGQYILGPNVEAFEHEIAAAIGVPHAVGLNSGTDALHLALRALDIGPGDDVITTAFSFVATTEAIGIVGARPVFADIDPRTYAIDPAAIRAAITPRTKAIVPVHLYGTPAPMDEIEAIAARYGLAVIEDCAQAIGARCGARAVGAIGTMGAFSFFPSKNLGACGDAGLVTTASDALAKRLRALRAHGSATKYQSDELGVNSRLDEVQAAILRVKLRHLHAWNSARRRIAARYGELLAGIPEIVLPAEPPAATCVYHQYTIRVRERERVQRALADAGVQTMVYYPVALHRQRAYTASWGTHRALPHSEAAVDEVLSLPIYPELEDAHVDTVAAGLRGAFARVTA